MRTPRPAFWFVIVGALSVAVFWRTAFPSITWWDASSYPIAARTMGVTSAPGSLILTIIGWPVAHLPFVTSPAHALNLLAGWLGALTTVLVLAASFAMLRRIGYERTTALCAGAALGVLTFAFSPTLWEHATKFTPYVLTTVFTAIILWTMIRWWSEADDPRGWRYVVLLALLFGLDFSVHRTNALLMPAAIAWIAIRRARTLVEPRAVAGSILAMGTGLSLQLLVIPIATATQSPLWNRPTTLAAFWDYISLSQLGGGFLVQFFPRKTHFWSVQVADVMHMLSENFVRVSGTTRFLGALAAVAAIIGIIAMWRRERRLGIAFVTVLFLQTALTILYFNIPPDFFRSLHRHYLPIAVTVAIAIACGVAVTMQWAVVAFTRRRMALPLAFAALAVIPGAQLIDNWHALDAHDRYFAADYARNALESLPPRAIYFTAGDNDTYPVLYMQAVEGVRRDVEIINVSVASLADYPEQIRRRVPAFPLSLTRSKREALMARPWTDTTLVVPRTQAANTRAADTAVTMHPRPQFGSKMTATEIVLYDIVRTNAWQRPITFASTTGGATPWLAPFARRDGLYWSIVPEVNPANIADTLRANLIRGTYRGYADPTTVIDDVSRTMGAHYLMAFDALLAAHEARGDIAACRRDKSMLTATLQPQRLALGPMYSGSFAVRCGGSGTGRGNQ